MGGLIPLMLRTNVGDSRNSTLTPPRDSLSAPPVSPRTSLPAPTRTSPTFAIQLNKRPASLLHGTRSNSPPRNSVLFNKPLPPKPKMIKRFSNLPPGTLNPIPTCTDTWKKTILEVKRLHFARRYRLCSAKCCELIEGLRGVNSLAEPAYLIYLHFYAASSLEMTARPIPITSPLRVKLLEQARSHYSTAAMLIQTAEDGAVSRSRPSSVASSFSRHSPIGSVSSRSGTPSTDITSPSSIFSPPGPPPTMMAPSPPTKKKVSFYMPVPEEPMVRPDSPTLGFDDFEAIENASRDLPPLPRHSPRLSILKPARPSIDTTNYPNPGRSCSVSSIASMTTASTNMSSPDSYMHGSPFGSLDFDASTYQWLSRICSHLDSLRSQVSYHIAAVDSELATCINSPTYDPSTARPSSMMSNYSVEDGGRPGSRSSVSSDGIPMEDLSERVARLRANGWKRQRFDPRRYEALRERILEELGDE